MITYFKYEKFKSKKEYKKFKTLTTTALGKKSIRGKLLIRLPQSLGIMIPASGVSSSHK